MIAIGSLVDHYGWWLAALVLIGAEMIAPGYFLLWIGLAAAIMGALMLVLPDLSAIVQAVVFALLAIVVCGAYWKFLRPRFEHRDDQPLLNRRAMQLVGQRFVLVEPIVNGRGKVRVGDGAWLAEGPDLVAGSEVEVVAVSGTALRVRAVS